MPFALTAHDVLVVVVHLVLAVVGIRLIVIDARTHRLPNRIVLPTLGAVVVLAVVDGLVTGEGERMLRSLLGGLILGGFYALMRVMSRQGVGGGDVKLAAVIGVVLGWHGWATLMVGAFAAFLLGSLYAIVLMVLRRADRSTRIAFGPWMIIGAALAVVIT